MVAQVVVMVKVQVSHFSTLTLAFAVTLLVGCGDKSSFKSFSNSESSTAKQCLPPGKTQMTSGKWIRVDDMEFYVPKEATIQQGVAYSLGPVLNKWPGGIVPLKFSSGISETERQRFYQACAHWTAVANVACVAYTNQQVFLSVGNSSSGNYSGYGAHPGTELNIHPSSWNNTVTMIHELGHALGMMHEHQRADRDQYIEVHFGNVSFGLSSQFNKVAPENSIGSYDFLSIMHYDANAFSSNGQPTMTVRPGYEAYANTFGMYKRTTVSEGDKAAMSRLYGPATGQPPQQQPTAPPGTSTPAEECVN
jgi:hypothetical protein